MQVSHAEESNNYAIIGGGAAREFKISASSHAFKILTDALYQDKPYAVSRETICNATDAHIMGGIPERPIEISLSETQLIVKDFGPGIADEAIQDTYCTLFGSTKTDDDRQTGGFGLGCKAPFSMTDHFMVISCHGGIKSTYAMTVGNDDTDGKPAAQLMHSGKTAETGLTVIVPIEAAQQHKFQRAIERTVRDGGVKALLNGELITAVRDYTGIETAGFGLYPKSDHQRCNVAILFGNVLYPLDRHEGTQDALDKLTSAMGKTPWQLVLYAPPSSVTPKPDREALGYNDKTLATVNKIARRAYNQIAEQEPHAVRELFLEAMQGVRRHNYAQFRTACQIRSRLENVYNTATTETVSYTGGNTYEKSVLTPKVVVGAKAVARAIAYERLCNDDVEGEKLDGIAANYYRDRRKGLVRSSFNLHAERNEYMLRRILRAVLPVVPTRNVAGFRLHRSPATTRRLPIPEGPTLRFRASTGSKLVAKRFTSYKDLTEGLTRFGGPPTLTLAPTSTLANTSRFMGYFLITASLKPEQIVAIKTNAERLGFKVNNVERPASVVVVVKLKETKLPVSRFFTPFKVDRDLHYGGRVTGRRRHSSSDNYYCVPSQTLDKPASFVAVAFKRRKITWKPKPAGGGTGPVQPQTEMMANTITQSVYSGFNGVLRNEEKVAMPRSGEERDRLLAAGVPRYADALLKRAKAAIDFKSEEHALIAAMANRRNVSNETGRDETLRFAVSLISNNRRLACAALMQPYSQSDKLDGAITIWRELHAFFGTPQHDTHWFDQIEVNAFKAAHVKYQQFCKAFEPHLPQELCAFFDRIRFGRLKANDVEHLEFLAKIVTERSSIRSLAGEDLERFASMIEDEGRAFVERGPKELQPTDIETEEDDWE